MPFPVLLNTWKHHAATLRRRIQDTVDAGPEALEELVKQIAVIGTDLMDLYLGRLSSGEIAQQVLRPLQTDNSLTLERYRAWLREQGDYAVIGLDDSSRWVLRLGDEQGRYVHIHPGRNSPHTRRVRANVLKTAVLAMAYAALHGRDPLNRDLLDTVRRQYLGLSPLGRDPSEDKGLGAIIRDLR